MAEWKDKLKATTSGKPAELSLDSSVPTLEQREDGQYKDYWVLPEEERLKGFVRPFRNKYIHKKCQVETMMSTPISETYARDPKFYGSTFCISCKQHFPVSEFLWSNTNEEVGS